MGLFSKTPEEKLLAAAEDGNFGGVCEALKLRADVNSDTPSRWTALHYAAAKGRDDIVRVLLNSAANIEAETDVGRRPLHWAARNGHSEAARMLLNAGCEKDVASSHSDGGCSPLHLAVQQGKVSSVRLLLECGASVQRTHSGGVTPLHDAARGGHVHVTALLLGVGGASIINAQDGVTEASLAAATLGLTPEPTAEGATPLHLAAAAGELGTVRLLIENGADMARKSNSGRTPMDCAKDEATLFVFQSGTSPAREQPKDPSLPALGRSLSSAAMELSPAAAPAPAAALPDDLASWLANLSLSAYAEPLGLVSLADVEAMEECDLKEAGLKPAERKRFLAAQKLLGGVAAD